MTRSVRRIGLGMMVWALLVAASPADDFVPTAAEGERLELMSRPPSWFIANLAGPREVVDGQHLDPKLQYYYEGRRRRPADQVKRGLAMFLTEQDRAVVRARLAREWALTTKATAPMQSVEDRKIQGRGGPIPIRIYTPVTRGPGPMPVLLYFHGGGWIYSGIEAVDRVSRLIANEANAIVISVEYRLAPEHIWPAANDDGEDAFLWVRANAAALGADPAMIGVGGDSAGGAISLSISRRQLSAGRPGPLYQLLYYTSVDFEPRYRSSQLFGNGYGLDWSFRDFMIPLAFGDEATAKRAAAEIRPKNLKNMPATILVTAGFDILRDPAQAMARQMERDGVAVAYLNYPTLTHGFLQFSGVVEDADRAATDSARLFGNLIRGRGGVLRAAWPK